MNSQWDQKVFRGVSIGGAIILPELKDDLIPWTVIGTNHNILYMHHFFYIFVYIFTLLDVFEIFKCNYHMCTHLCFDPVTAVSLFQSELTFCGCCCDKAINYKHITLNMIYWLCSNYHCILRAKIWKEALEKERLRTGTTHWSEILVNFEISPF